MSSDKKCHLKRIQCTSQTTGAKETIYLKTFKSSIRICLKNDLETKTCYSALWQTLGSRAEINYKTTEIQCVHFLSTWFFLLLWGDCNIEKGTYKYYVVS